MLDGPLVFLDIDTQRDFLEPTGSLFIPGSETIRENLARLTRYAREHGIPLLATACAHTLDEVDPEPFPPHCLVGTAGQRRIAETEWPAGARLAPDQAFDEASGIAPHLTLEKARYDVFSRPDAGRIVSRYSRDRPTFVVYGVATDYCVRAAVLGLLDRGQNVVVVVDAVHAIDREGEADQFREFVERGATLALTEVICGRNMPAGASLPATGATP